MPNGFRPVEEDLDFMTFHRFVSQARNKRQRSYLPF